MGAMLRALDADSPLGSPRIWPVELRSLVGVMLTAPQPMFLAWGEAQLMIYNDAYAEILGNHHPALGKPFLEVWAEIAERVGPIMARAYAGRSTYMDDIELILHRHGRPEEAHFSFFYTPVRGDTGAVNGVFCACSETTRQVVAAREMQEQARVLRESEEKFRTFSQSMANQVWTAPANGQLDWFNEQTLSYSGLSMAALSAVGWTQLVHPEDLDAAAAAWSQALATGSSYEIEFRIRRADGDYRWHLVRALPIHDANGAVVRWVGTNTDVEQQRSDREALRQLNAHLERRVDERTRERDRIWRNAPDMIAVLGPDGIFIEANPAWTQTLGWAPHEVAGKRIDQLVHQDDRSNAELALQRATLGVLPSFECRVLHADGSYRSIAWTAAPEGDAIFAFGRDITPDKQQKLALELAEEQLRQSQKMEAIGQLTGGIAHDFNNMLASIYGSIQLMQRKLKTGKLEGFDILLERASTSTQRASSLTQRLLAFARRQSLDIRRVDVVKLIESLEDMFVRTLGPRVALTIELGTDLWSAKIDASQLESALLNLVINARDAMIDGGQLNIAVENVEIDAEYAATQAELNAGEYVAIRVTDDGAGMPASVIARAFEPFFTTKPIGQGTGLGLSMVYGFVKQAGGHIRIYSEPDKGTSVSLFLPRDMNDGASAEPAADLPQTHHVHTGETILVVEDEESVRSVIAAVLQDLGYNYIEAADAKAALAVIDTPTRIDLLVSDVGLPGMNGRQLAEIATARRPGLNVLFVTGYAEQAAVRHGFLTAGMQMITKPFVIDELANRVRSILTAPVPKPPAPPPPVRAGVSDAAGVHDAMRAGGSVSGQPQRLDQSGPDGMPDCGA
jgi:PAS domain S-box-containing protein